MVFTVSPVEGATIDSVYNGATKITGAENVSISNVNHTVTIKAAYLAAQSVGSITISIDMSKCSDLTSKINVIDTTV